MDTKKVIYVGDETTNEAIKDLRSLQVIRHRRRWKPFMQKYNCQRFAEIGVFASQNFLRMMASNPQVAVGVDLWKRDGNPAVNDSNFSQEVLDSQCDYFKSFMLDNPAIRLYREYSHEAVKHFPDEYFDLIYIDANHTYEGCKQDLIDWYPKVKKGKFFTGDDYSNSHAPVTGVKFGVIKAVNEFAAKNDLQVYELDRHGWAIIRE